jgi:sarcosine oxidase subunit gamma
LIIGAEADVAHMVERLNAQGGDEILALDVSHARFGMVLSGRDARLSLAAHCPLDLADDVFPVGMVARSLLGDTGMFLARLPDSGDGPQLRIVVDQTMAGYAVQMLAGFKSVGAHV